MLAIADCARWATPASARAAPSLIQDGLCVQRRLRFARNRTMDTADNVLRHLRPCSPSWAGRWSAAVMLAPASRARRAQSLVATVNGEPDHQLRYRPARSSCFASLRMPASRQAAIESLIEDRIKVSGRPANTASTPTEQDVDQAIRWIARERKIHAAAAGRSAAARRHRRQSTGRSIGKAEIGLDAATSAAAEQSRRGQREGRRTPNGVSAAKRRRSMNYKLQPIVLVVPRRPAPAAVRGARQEADRPARPLHDCDEGVQLARALRDVAVREPITRIGRPRSATAREPARQDAGRPSHPARASPTRVSRWSRCAARRPTRRPTRRAKQEIRDKNCYAKKLRGRRREALRGTRASAR